MKQKLMIKLTAVVTTVATLLGGCGIVGETKIEYERLVKALDEGDMATVMSAGEDGYAHVEEQVISSTREKKENETHSNRLYQTTRGVFNLTDMEMYGETTQKVKSVVKNNEGVTKDNQYNEELKYSTELSYKKGEISSASGDFDISPVALVFDKLQGINELTPTDSKQGGSEPNRISYSLTEDQFKNIVNDDLKLQYDTFNNASIVIYFNASKDFEENPMEIREIRIVVNYQNNNENNKVLRHGYQISVYFSSKENSTENVKKDYEEYKLKFNNEK